MSRPVLILRPQPGADDTAARARSLGLMPVAAPLFFVRPLTWAVPSASAFDAVMLTSANAARHGGDGLASFVRLPCYVVGESTAAAARQAGFTELHVGPADGAAVVAMMAAAGVRRVLHPCGEQRIVLPAGAVEIDDVPVYAAEPVERLPNAAADALGRGAIVLIHSPRAAALLSRLVPSGREQVEIAAISAAAARAAGPGWKRVTIATRPRDEALLELAAKLCQTAAE